MAIAIASVATTNGAKYVTQLCKHWSHKFPTELTEDKGTVRFQSAVVDMTARDDSILVEINAESADEAERMKAVVAKHLDRFAFREAPLSFDWRPMGSV